MIRQEVSTAVKAIVTKIKETTAVNGKLVSFDFTGSTPFVASQAIQKLLTEKGYITIIVFGASGSERMYIDLSRPRVKPVVSVQSEEEKT